MINSATQDHCLLCKVSRHKFVDCDEFKKLSPQERTNAMKRLHRCFTCLAPMHREPKTCRYRRRCLTCNKSHHRLLACALNNSTRDIPVESPRPSHLSLNAETPQFHANANSVSLPQDKKPNFKLSPSTYVELLGSDGTWHRAIALFDSGSDVTLIRRDMVKKLNLDRKPQQFKFGIAGGGYYSEDSAIVSLWIRRCDKHSSRFNISAVELSQPAHQLPGVNSEIFENYSFLEPIRKFIPEQPNDVDILIGFDYASLTTPLNYLQHIYEPTRNPTAAETQLGWYLFGPKNWSNVYLNEITNIQFIQTRDDLKQMYSLYESELSGVKPSKLCACSDNAIIKSNFIRHVKNTIHQTEDDIASSFDSERKAVYVKQNVEKILSTGKFSVKGWHSNSLADEFPTDVETDVLGHVWNKSSDTFAPKVIHLNTKARLTKRLILSAI